ncbi:CU044_2847 family protein [Spongiactinospora sp. TRM90649]|uniref:CU044_2847 family protein n=1 Tax=Spongiactinospora sp. TRM90649 TaxID=3031114 RepID=UPI0023F6887E|nr:CU044_2847 family protein [Spongiactinospora sp. TRM90649]MDF5753631.1 CU044_2847 family protein [Spongiactinospora sp. TRM90649]
MTQLLAVPVAGGEAVLFEVDAASIDGSDLELAAGNGAVARARASLDDVLRTIRPALGSVAKALKDMRPDELEIEFGVKVGAESSVVIAKGTTEANFTIRLLWRQP